MGVKKKKYIGCTAAEYVDSPCHRVPVRMEERVIESITVA
jgi:hypothetical protein